ncbi:MAG: tRNA lysidine(34) synthetase TilS [Bacteroidales bacterium]|nr:tRNA lysidine(34) synthetase TilS [Bacteroidales bacterium]
MIERFRAALDRLTGGDEGCRYLLAVSGGADSTVMAYLFRAAGLDMAIAHCNFHLRGEDSNHDMRLVQQLAEQLDVPLFIQEFDTFGIQKNSGLSIEMTARKLRYDWFDKIGRDFDFIVTAHQANDVAETLLLNLCRGTGLKGLASIPPKNGKIIRPMLDFTAEEIRQYAVEHDIPFAIDCTNADETIKRNRIRKTVLPQLAELNPNLIHTFSKNCDIFRQQYDFYRQQMDEIMDNIRIATEQEDKIQLDILEKYPCKNLILYELLNGYGFAAEVAEEIVRNREIQSGTRFLSSSHTLVVNREHLLIRKNQPKQDEERCFRSLEELQKCFNVERCSTEKPIRYPKDNRTLFIPEEKLVFPLTLRPWHQGDYFYPLGGKGKQKLSDFFTDHKIDVFQKQEIRLLCSGNDILWIVGFRSDERYKITSETTFYYKITDYGNC